MNDLWVALGLVLVLEGALYALFPQRMVDMMKQLPEIPVPMLRAMGFFAVALGWLVVWLIRGN
ncbi:MAG: DUF2065 domain-containing protein [Zetaproteobacteria bacterium]|nr:DUF2065 domain-containing protein [Zetaproteobacteria bacterium]